MIDYSFQKKKRKRVEKYDAVLSCCPYHYLKVSLMIWYHRIFRLIFHRQSSCPKKCPNNVVFFLEICFALLEGRLCRTLANLCVIG